MHIAASAAVALATPFAQAQQEDPGRRLYVDGGLSLLERDRARALTLGALLPSSLFPAVARTAGPLTLHWDLSLTHWRAPRPAGGSADFSQLAGAAVWRHAIGGANGPWFLDLGLGASVYDRHYFSGERRFSTGFQFTEALGLGYRFGPARTWELSLRIQHVSNAGIKKPNPGENMLRVRVGTAF